MVRFGTVAAIAPNDKRNALPGAADDWTGLFSGQPRHVGRDSGLIGLFFDDSSATVDEGAQNIVNAMAQQ